ncbi:MAG TPA: hypothetical protein VK404_10645, partial [Spirosoma sp.]|nr:hypothetical protein [Spirosoma sp.]
MKELYEEILQNVRTGDQLSAVFPSALIFAKKVSNVQLENWILLETNGYYNSNSAMEEGTVVPEYRSVPGRWHDIHGRPFILNDPDLQFINEYRLRNPVFDIEELSRNTSHIDLPDAKFTSKIKERFNVDVYAFRFSPKSLAGVLSSIRSHLITSLMSLGHEESIQKQESSATDLSLLHPTVKSVSGD